MKWIKLQKYIYLGIICLLFPLFSFALDNELPIPDSLLLKVQNAKRDSSRLSAMYNIAAWLKDHRSDLAEQYFLQVVDLAQKSENIMYIAKMENLYGIYYYNLPDYDKALQHYYKTISLFDSLKNEKELARAYYNVGLTFGKIKDFPKALSFYRKAQSMNQKIGNVSSLIKNYNGMGFLYDDMGKKDSAFFYYQKSLDLATAQKDTKGIMIARSNLGDICMANHHYKEAEAHFITTYQITLALKEPHRIVIAARSLGNLYLQTGRLVEAEKYLKAALTHSEKQAYKQDIEKCYLYLSQLAEKKGNPSQALAYYQKYHAISDSVLNDEKNKSIREYDIKYQSQKKEQENNLLRKKNTIKGLQIYGLGFIAILLALFIAYFYYINQQMKHKNALITQQKDELFAANQALNALLQEKDNIIATVSHDYRSPLGRIRAVVDLVMLQKENLSEKQQKHLQKIPVILAEATHLIDDLLDVTYIDRLTSQLHPERFEVKGELQAIIEDYQHWITQKNLTITYHFPSENCEIYTDKPAFKRVFDNLISNAIKYSHTHKNISLFIEKQEKRYSIVVKDEGQGFSAEDKTRIFTRFQRLSAQPIAVGNSYGLGLSIVKTLVEGLGATIELEESTAGASFRIDFE